MSGFFPFLTKAHENEEAALNMLERREFVSDTTQGRQENADLHDALIENQTIEKKQMEVISESQKQQEKTEEALQASVRFPRDEAFQHKMRNAEGYVRRLIRESENKKAQHREMERSITDVIWWQEHPAFIETDSKNVKNARTYWQRYLMTREKS